MSKEKSKGFEWQESLNDRTKSLSRLSSKAGLIPKETERKKSIAKSKLKEKNQVKTNLSEFEKLDEGHFLDIAKISVIDQGLIKKFSDSYYSIGKILLEAKKDPIICFILSWPSSIDWLVISQFLVNEELLRRSSYADGYKLGIFPARVSAFGRLRKFRLNRQILIKEAQDAANRGIYESTRIMAYLSLQEFSKIDTPSEREHPSLQDLTPGFYLHEKEGWCLHGKGYLSDIYTYMFNASGNARRETIHKASETLNDPQAATEGIFLAPPTTKSHDLLNLFKLDNKIDAVVIDAKEKNIEYGNISKGAAASIFQTWFRDFEKNSLVLLFDNPLVMNSFRKEVFLAYKRTNAKVGKNFVFKQYAILKLEDNPVKDNNGINNNIAVGNEYQYTSPKINILGLGHIPVFKELIKIALEVENLEPKLAQEMKRAIGFLLRISCLPISQNGLLNWIKNVSEGWSEDHVISLSRKYLWKSYFRAWKQRVSDFGVILSVNLFETECEKIAGLIQESTETEERILQLAINCLDKPNEKILIVTVERKTVDFINAIISDYGCDELFNQIDVSQFSSELNLEGYDQVAVFGLNDRRLKDILLVLSEKNNCNEIYINAYSFLKIHHELQYLRNVEALSPIHEWIDGLKSQIEPVLSSMEGLNNLISVNTNEISRPYEHQNYDQDVEKYATVHLSGYGAIDVAQHSTLIRVRHTELSDWEPTTVDKLSESDCIVVIDDHFVESFAEITKVTERTNEEERKILKSYFSLAQDSIQSKYNQKSRRARASAIHSAMAGIDSEKASGITHNMIERWLKNIEEFNDEDSRVVSGSARKQSHYLLFAKAINLDESLASIFWQKGIRQFRANNIQEGKKLANDIRYLLVGLLDHRLFGISEKEYTRIKNIARGKEFDVEMITYMER